MLHSAIFEVNSRNRADGTHSNFLYEIKIDPSKKYDRVVVLQASIPKSYYLVQDGRNTFQIQEDAKTTTITVPKGNYSASGFATVVSALMQEASPNGLTYKITSPTSFRTSNTGKFVYAVENWEEKKIECKINVGAYLFEQLGFDANTSQTFVSGSLTSTNVINFQLEDTLFIHSDIANNGRDDVLQEIFASNTQDYSKIEFFNRDPLVWSRELSTHTSNVYRFSITDEDGQLIDFNGRNIVFTLLVYKKDTMQTKLAEIALAKIAKSD